jgi:O-antigen/teichoic acid export membrane protein
MKRPTDSTEPRKLIARASIAAAGTAYQQGLSFTSGLIIARVIGAADYGIFNLARSLVDITAIITRLGLEIGLQRFFGEASTPKERAARVAVLRRLRLVASGVALLPVAAVALGLGSVVEANVYRFSGFAEILLCLALALPFSTDIAVLGGAYRGILKLPPAVLAEAVLMPTIRLSIIVILFLLGWRLWAVVVGTTLGSFLASAFLAARARVDFHDDGHAPADSWLGTLRVIRYSSVLGVAVLVTTLTSTMDVLFLGRFATATDVGQYSLLKMLLVLMGFFGAAFNQTLGALVAERHSRGDRMGMVRVMSMTARWIALGTVPIFAILLFWGSQLTLLFGASFTSSPAVVAWLAASQFVVVLFGPAGWALSMTGKHVLEFKILVIGLIVATISCALAVPVYGQLGAAIATSLSVATTNLVRVVFVRRSAGAFPFAADVFVITAVGLVAAWVCDVVVAQLSSPGFWSAIAGSACFLTVYAVAGWTCLLDANEKGGIRGLLARAVLACNVRAAPSNSRRIS